MEKSHTHNSNWNEKKLYKLHVWKNVFRKKKITFKNIISPRLISPVINFVSIWYRFRITTLVKIRKKIIKFSHTIDWFFELAWKLASEFIVQPQMSSKTQFSLEYQYLWCIRSLFARQNDSHYESIQPKWKSVLKLQIPFQTQTLEIAFIHIIYRNFKELTENSFDRIENVATILT